MKNFISEIKKQIRRKLGSRSGASILFALLLFLVCAAIGSVILTAGTAAAGRFSKTAEMDQRFYAVQSAAQLFRDLLDGQSVGIIREKTSVDTEIKTSYKDSYGAVSESFAYGSDEPVFTMEWLDGSSVIEASTANVLVSKVALNVLCGGVTDPADAWGMLASSSNPSYSESLQLQLSAGEDAPVSELPVVTVNCNAAPDGSMTFDFSADQYKVRLRMLASVTEGSIETRTTDSSTAVGEGTPESNLVITTVSTTVESKTSSVRWSFGSLDVVGK